LSEPYEVHGFLVGHDREFAEVHTHGVLEHVVIMPWNSARISSSVQERGFDIDLRELGLAVGAQSSSRKHLVIW
jgi:hypothetical protein